ncbi:MAG: 2Fe-2S iron-sulfur cluster binding domain-containing protein [Methylococcales bacterium]|nr:2Fe-2S iron-sulfur cluster binding domain-containing protein [Methylococcales bacterium]
MKYKITLSTRDDQQFEFSCEDKRNIQDAAEAASLYLPFGCKSGACGTCQGTCTTGDYQLSSYSEDVLSTDAAANGNILLCRTVPKTDLHIKVPYDAESIQLAMSVPRDAKIVSIDKIAERTLKVVLQLQDDPELGLAFEFEPGQFVELEVPDLSLKRAYSLSNTANWEGYLEFLIRLQANGKFSEFLQKTTVGQQLLVHKPSGTFVINKQSSNPRCFIAGGTGLAPFLSILKRMAEWVEDHPTHLFLGVNNEAEILCQEELTMLQQSLPQLTVKICVWKPENNWKGFIGTPVDAFKSYLEKNGAENDVYLCGPPVLVEASMNAALEAGVNKEHIYSERFVSSKKHSSM